MLTFAAVVVGPNMRLSFCDTMIIIIESAIANICVSSGRDPCVSMPQSESTGGNMRDFTNQREANEEIILSEGLDVKQA